MAYAYITSRLGYWNDEGSSAPWPRFRLSRQVQGGEDNLLTPGAPGGEAEDVLDDNADNWESLADDGSVRCVLSNEEMQWIITAIESEVVMSTEEREQRRLRAERIVRRVLIGLEIFLCSYLAVKLAMCYTGCYGSALDFVMVLLSRVMVLDVVGYIFAFILGAI